MQGLQRKIPVSHIAAFVIVSALSSYAGCARAVDPPAKPQTSQALTSAPTALNGIHDRTYASTGIENSLGASGYLFAEGDIQVQQAFVDLYNSDVILFGTIVPQDFLQLLKAHVPKPNNPRDAHEFVKGITSVLNEVLKGSIALPPDTLKKLNDIRKAKPDLQPDSRFIRAYLDVFFAPGTADSKYLVMRTNVFNLIAAKNQVLNNTLLGNKEGLAVATREYRSHLPPISINTYSFGFDLSGERDTVSPELAHSNSVAGYDVSLGGMVGTSSFGGTASGGSGTSTGVSLAFKQDVSPARMLTSTYIGLIHNLKKLLGLPPDEADRRLKEYLSELAHEYPRMSMSPRFSLSAGYNFVDGPLPPTNPPTRHMSVATGGASASWLRPLRGRGNDLKVYRPSAGVAGLVSAQEIIAMPDGFSSQNAVRVSASVWYQDAVPYYVESDDPNVIGEQRYKFDHWHLRIGAEYSNKTKFDETAPWSFFVRFRTLPSSADHTSIFDILRRDINYTVSAGVDGNRQTVVAFKVNRVF